MHLDVQGATLKQWETSIRIAPDRPVRVLDVDSYYEHIVDRTRELLHAQLLVNGRIVSSDTLFFCPFSEIEILPEPLLVSVEKVEPDTWSLDIEVGAVAKMIELEGNKKLLFSDNYFVQIPGIRKKVQITLLEDTSDEELMLTVSSMDNPNVRRIALH